MIFRGLLVLVEALFWLLVLRLLLRALAFVFAPGRPAAARPVPRAGLRAPEKLVLDRVCRTYVPQTTALCVRVAGREEHFCSEACRDKALAAVARAS
jgi:YHS domain-containing protein